MGLNTRNGKETGHSRAKFGAAEGARRNDKSVARGESCLSAYECRNKLTSHETDVIVTLPSSLQMRSKMQRSKNLRMNCSVASSLRSNVLSEMVRVECVRCGEAVKE